MSASSSENTFFPLPYLSKNAVKLLALNYGECQDYDDCLEVGKTEGDKQNASATVSASAKQSASPKMMQTRTTRRAVIIGASGLIVALISLIYELNKKK